MAEQYELTVVSRVAKTTLKTKKTATELETLIAKHKGKVVKKSDWGVKDLAYQIKKQTKGNYVHWLVELSAQGVAEVSKQLTVDDKVLRYLIVKKDIPLLLQTAR